MNENYARHQHHGQENTDFSKVIKDLEYRLAEAENELAQFNYLISHDLLSPISTARGLLGLMQDDLNSGITDELSELLADSANQLVRLDSLVSDLLSVTKVSTSDPSIESFDLVSLVDDVVASLSMNALEISVTVITDNPVIKSDRVRVQQILANLISNARKFVDPEELAPEITVSCEHADSSVWLRIADNGIGIDPVVANKLFGLFARGTGEQSNHGLGLFIVKKHAARLGGDVEIVSYCKPTLFEVCLPNELEQELSIIENENIVNQTSMGVKT